MVSLNPDSIELFKKFSNNPIYVRDAHRKLIFEKLGIKPLDLENISGISLEDDFYDDENETKKSYNLKDNLPGVIVGTSIVLFSMGVYYGSFLWIQKGVQDILNYFD
jgi:hypothetical protein